MKNKFYCAPILFLTKIFDLKILIWFPFYFLSTHSSLLFSGNWPSFLLNYGVRITLKTVFKIERANYKQAIPKNHSYYWKRKFTGNFFPSSKFSIDSKLNEKEEFLCLWFRRVFFQSASDPIVFCFILSALQSVPFVLIVQLALFVERAEKKSKVQVRYA